MNKVGRLSIVVFLAIGIAVGIGIGYGATVLNTSVLENQLATAQEQISATKTKLANVEKNLDDAKSGISNLDMQHSQAIEHMNEMESQMSMMMQMMNGNMGMNGMMSNMGSNNMMPGSMGGMDGSDMGMMSEGMGMIGMMQAMMGGPFDPTLKPISTTEATRIANEFVASLNNPDLEVGHFQSWANNYYFNIMEKSTEKFTHQMLINKYTGQVFPEMGPNMMWTSKSEMTLTKEEAKQKAEQFLQGYILGADLDKGITFYGYYHFLVLKEGKLLGMLDVNGFSGQVWFHTWHGPPA